MKPPKPKQPSSYSRAEQIPLYTSYGWRRLQVGETIKETDWRTADSNPVNFLLVDSTKGSNIPRFGFLSCKDQSSDKITDIAAKYLVYIRPWFPNRNPLLKAKQP